MKSAITLKVLYKLVPIFIKLPTISTINTSGNTKVILIYEIATCIIRRVYIYEFHLP